MHQSEVMFAGITEENTFADMMKQRHIQKFFQRGNLAENRTLSQ